MLLQVRVMQPHHYQDTVHERFLANNCGYPICPNPLPKRASAPLYRIDVANLRVLDNQEMQVVWM